MFISQLHRDVTKKWYVLKIKNNRFLGDRIISTRALVEPRARLIAEKCIARNYNHPAEASRIRAEARRKEERDCPWRKAAISCALLQAGVRPPDGRRALCSSRDLADPLLSLSLTILAKVRGAARDRWNRRAKEDTKKWRRKTDTGPQLAGLLPKQTWSLPARTGPMGKRKIKYIIISFPSLSLFLSLYRPCRIRDASQSRDWKIETREVYRTLRGTICLIVPGLCVFNDRYVSRSR